MTRSRSRRAALVAAGAVLAVLGLAGCGAEAPQGRYAGVSSTVAPAGADLPAEGLAAARRFRSVRGYRATALPVRLEIPGIGVSTALERLGRAPDRTVEVPSEWQVAGWYAEGPRPGDPGSAVVLGHVDSRSGPAVFYRLDELGRGDRVEVVRADGSRARFTVDRTERYEKDRFPTADVYYPTLTPMLRLVTCGGPFDLASGHYRDNVIVFATLDR
jgi:sortase (surface protein transpeptidase)